MKVNIELETKEFGALAKSRVWEAISTVLEDSEREIEVAKPGEPREKKEEPKKESKKQSSKEKGIDVKELTTKAKKVLGDLMKQGKKDEVAGLLEDFGANKLSDVKDEDLVKLIEKAKEV